MKKFNKKYIPFLSFFFVLIIFVSLFVNVFAITTISQSTAPSSIVNGSATNILVMDYNINVANDSYVFGKIPFPGTASIDGIDNDWSNVYFYDAVSGGEWDPSVDSIWLDDGFVYYDNGKDILISGKQEENIVGSETEPIGWNLFYYNDNVDDFKIDVDWIGLDEDADGIYTVAADFLVDADGNITLYSGSTNLSPGDVVYDLVISDLIVADNESIPTKVWRDTITNNKYTGYHSFGVVEDGDGDIGANLESLFNIKVTGFDGVFDVGEGVYISSDNILDNTDTIIVGATLQSLTNGKVSGDDSIWSGDATEGIWDDVGSLVGFIDTEDVHITNETLLINDASLDTLYLTNVTGIAIGDTLSISSTNIISGKVLEVFGNVVLIDSTNYSDDGFNLLQSVAVSSEADVVSLQNLSGHILNSSMVVLENVTGIAIGDVLKLECDPSNYWEGNVLAINSSSNLVLWNAVEEGTCFPEDVVLVSLTSNSNINGLTTIPLQSLFNIKVTGFDGVFDVGEGVYISSDNILDNTDTIIVGATLQSLTNGKVTILGSSNGVLDEEEVVFIDVDESDNVSIGDFRLMEIPAELVILGNPVDGIEGINVGIINGWVKEINRTWVNGDDIFIESFAGGFTYSNSSDETIAGTVPSLGSVITTNKPISWSNVYFYDAVSGGEWDPSVDSIWLDDGFVYYDNGKDILISGKQEENLLGLQGSSSEWKFDSIDFLDGGSFDVLYDSIIIDIDDNDYYLDKLNAITMYNIGTLDISKINNVRFWMDSGEPGFQGIGTDILLGNAYYNDTSGWFISDLNISLFEGNNRFFVSIDFSNANDGDTVLFKIQNHNGGSVFDIGDTGLFLESIQLGNITNEYLTIVDALPPFVDIGSDIVVKNSLFFQNASVNDLNGVAYYNWSKIDGPGDIFFSTPNEEDTNISASVDGVYTILLTVTDTVGNINNDTFILIWDTTPADLLDVHVTPDRFVCAVENSSLINSNFTLKVKAVDETSGILWIKANISKLTNESSIIDLEYDPITGFYEKTISVTNTEGYHFEPRNVDIILSDNASNIALGFTYVILYDFDYPEQDPYSPIRFSNSMTNLCEVQDFNNVNYVIELELNGSILYNSLLNSLPWVGFKKVLTLNFSSLNFSDNDTLQKLGNLQQYINVNITPPGSFGDSFIYVDSVGFSELNSNAIISFYGLPFSDVEIPGINEEDILIFPDNPYNFSGIILPKINLTFNVPGFSQYNITDSAIPQINVVSPLSRNYSSSNILLNVTINGTGTSISLINFTLDEEVILSLNNTFEVYTYCDSEGSGEVIICEYLVSNLTNGPHKFTVISRDLGGTSGNNNNFSLYFDVDLHKPQLFVYSPVNNVTYYTTQDIFIDYNATDNFFVDSKWYYNGTSNISYDSKHGIKLSNGTYTFIFYANDTANNINYIPITFRVVVPSINTTVLNSSINNLTLSQDSSKIVVPPYNNNLTLITTNKTINESVILDLSQRINLSGYVTISNNNLTIIREGLKNYTLIIPENTWIINNSGPWNGEFILPTMQSNVYTIPNGVVDVAIKIGSDVNLTLTKPVKIIFSGMSGKKVGFTDSGTVLNKITLLCIGADNYSNIGDSGECYFDDGVDLIIWTKHLTVFGVYSDVDDEKEENKGSSRGYSSSYYSVNPYNIFTYDYLRSGIVVLKIMDNTIPFTEIVFESSQNASNVKFIVRRQDNPLLINKSGLVYKYVELNHSGINDSMISSVSILFKVEKSWILNNNLDGKDIFLYRYVDDWQQLKTTFIREDNIYFYYNSSSPGLSLFAISIKQNGQNLTNIIQNNITKEEDVSLDDVKKSIEIYSNNSNIEGDNNSIFYNQQKVKNEIITLIVMVIAILLIVVMSFVYYKRNKKY